MKIFACFPSKYLKAADLCNKHVSAIMSHVAMEEVRGDADDAKLLPILYFRGIPKGLVLNKTNSKIISAAYDEETDAWKGMPIVLFSAMVAYGSDTVEAIRLKAPSAAERIRAIQESPHKDALAEHMLERFHDRPINTAWVPPSTTEADMARARQVFATKKPTPRPVVMPISDVVHDEDGVVWDDTEVRKPTKDDGLDLPAVLRVVKSEPSLKDRLIAEVRELTSPQDILRWSLGMSGKIGDVLTDAERNEIATATAAHHITVMATQMPPLQHQRQMFK
jgi:hypothetical protein